MTAYAIKGPASTGGQIGVRAGSLELRLTAIAAYSTSTTGRWITIKRYDSSSLSGGTALDIVPMWQGAPAASGTAQYGTLSLSGTNNLAGEFYLNPLGVSTVAAGSVYSWNQYSAGTVTFQSPLPLTISPGGVLVVGGLVDAGYMIANLTFEELRPPKSY